MRRILIDNAVEARAKEFAEVMKGNKPDKLDWGRRNTPLDKLKEFYKGLRKDSKTARHALYVYNIIVLYNNLLFLEPNIFKDVYESYFMQWDDILNDEIDYGGKKQFYEHVIDCMGYTRIRSGLLREYMKDQRIKACVYCNSQYAITTEEFKENSRKKRIGTYQFDHNWPESEYPFLCTSYYNLIPSCPTCNQTKLQRKAFFNLYTTNPAELDVFRFELTPDKAVESYVEQDMDKLEVKLKCDSSQDMLDNHQELFHIDLIYTQHIDVVQRIIVILKANESFYRKSLQDSLSTLFPMGVEDPGYFFFGYYMEKENIHLQLLSKLVQDVVEQVSTA